METDVRVHPAQVSSSASVILAAAGVSFAGAGSRFVAFGHSALFNVNSNPALIKFIENSIAWANSGIVPGAGFKITVAHVSASYYHNFDAPMRASLLAWFPGATVNAINACEGPDLPGCLAESNMLVISEQMGKQDDPAAPYTTTDSWAVMAAVRDFSARGLPVIYSHYGRGCFELGTVLLGRVFGLTCNSNYWSQAALSGANQSTTESTLAGWNQAIVDINAAVNTVTESTPLNESDVSMCLTASGTSWVDGRSIASFQAKLQRGLNQIRSYIAAYETTIGASVFSGLGSRWIKLLVLLGDKYRTSGDPDTPGLGYPIPRNNLTRFAAAAFADVASTLYCTRAAVLAGSRGNSGSQLTEKQPVPHRRFAKHVLVSKPFTGRLRRLKQIKFPSFGWSSCPLARIGRSLLACARIRGRHSIPFRFPHIYIYPNTREMASASTPSAEKESPYFYLAGGPVRTTYISGGKVEENPLGRTRQAEDYLARALGAIGGTNGGVGGNAKDAVVGVGAAGPSASTAGPSVNVSRGPSSGILSSASDPDKLSNGVLDKLSNGVLADTDAPKEVPVPPIITDYFPETPTATEFPVAFPVPDIPAFYPVVASSNNSSLNAAAGTREPNSAPASLKLLARGSTTSSLAQSIPSANPNHTRSTTRSSFSQPRSSEDSFESIDGSIGMLLITEFPDWEPPCLPEFRNPLSTNRSHSYSDPSSDAKKPEKQSLHLDTESAGVRLDKLLAGKTVEDPWASKRALWSPMAWAGDKIVKSMWVSQGCSSGR